MVIDDPVDGTVDQAITVTLRVLDQYDNIVLAEHRDFILLTSSPTANGGTVNIVNGQGTFALSNTKHEIVTLTLLDITATGLTVSSTQDVLFAPGSYGIRFLFTCVFSSNDRFFHQRMLFPPYHQWLSALESKGMSYTSLIDA